MYPFGDLPGNLTAFCARLRHEHGFGIGPGEIADAARALHAVELTDQRQVRDAWRVVLSSSRETAARFDAAFAAFFFPGPAGVAQDQQPPLAGRRERPGRGETTGERRPASGDPSVEAELDADQDAGSGPVVLDDEAADTDAAAGRARSAYSPLGVEGQEAVELRPVGAAWREAARLLLRRLRIGPSRRWTPARRGRRLDLRRTWRASLQTGGEMVTARWRRRAHRSPRVVVLIDGSRSMSGAHQPALDLATAVASATRRVGVFAFSTALTALTAHARAAGAGRPVRVGVSRENWGGGTSIGQSLRAFLRRHGERHVSADTLVIIVSDGLDVGEPTLLRDAMRDLHRRAAGVVWLNPLVATPGYQPSARGMRAARPFISTLAWVDDAEGLARLARGLRLRR